jgi:hypothetical protein
MLLMNYKTCKEVVVAGFLLLQEHFSVRGKPRHLYLVRYNWSIIQHFKSRISQTQWSLTINCDVW